MSSRPANLTYAGPGGKCPANSDACSPRECGPTPDELMDRPVTVRTYLDFEKPIAELESKVADLRALNSDDDGSMSITEEVTKLQQKAQQALVDTYAKLTPWQKTQVARHPDRPHSLDYARALIEDFTPLAGDRYFAEDAAIMGGLGPLPRPVRSCSSATRRAPTRRAASSTTSAWRGPRATARRCG